jgi:hypothetical protein
MLILNGIMDHMKYQKKVTLKLYSYLSIDNLVIEKNKAITEGASSMRVLKTDNIQGKGANSAV